jgi:hypothetical protein
MKPVKLINLTPHPVTIILRDGRQISLPSEGVVRVKEVVEDVGEIILDDGTTIPLRRKFLAEQIEGLPEPQDGVVYIVSFLAAQKAWELGRTDVISTGDPVRDEQGRIIGVTSFYVKP